MSGISGTNGTIGIFGKKSMSSGTSGVTSGTSGTSGVSGITGGLGVTCGGEGGVKGGAIGSGWWPFPLNSPSMQAKMRVPKERSAWGM